MVLNCVIKCSGMESRENSIFGRKTFFLNPTLNIEHKLIPHLRNMEYEVYQVRSHQDIKSVLRANPGSLCFINIDDQLSFSEWFNFIKSFEIDETLSSIFLGIISAKAKNAVKEQFILKTKLPGGFIDSSDHPELVLSNFTKILDINGAKGRRQYVRIDQKILGKELTTCFVDQKLINFTLMDLSATGFAAYTDPNKINLFPKGKIIENIGLKLGIKPIYVDAEIFLSQIRGEHCVVVFMFLKTTPEKIIKDIKSYIHGSLQKAVDDFINSSIKDLTDYSEEIIVPESDKKADINDLKFEDLGDLEELDVPEINSPAPKAPTTPKKDDFDPSIDI